MLEHAAASCKRIATRAWETVTRHTPPAGGEHRSPTAPENDTRIAATAKDTKFSYVERLNEHENGSLTSMAVKSAGNNPTEINPEPSASSVLHIDASPRPSTDEIFRSSDFMQALLTMRKIYGKVERQQDASLLLLAQTTQQLQKCEEVRRWIEQSVSAFAVRAESLAESEPSRGTVDTLGALEERVLLDSKQLVEQHQKTMEFETRLGAMMYELGQQHKHLFSAIYEVVSRIPGGKDILDGQRNLQPEDIGPDSLSSEHIPELAERYFEILGNVNLKQERLFELEIEHARSQQDREFLKDQERELEIPDDVFEENYLTTRRQLIAELDAENIIVERLEKECQNEGIDLHSLRFRGQSIALNESVFDPDPIFGKVTESEIFLNVVPDHVSQESTHSRQNPTDDVQRWLSGVESGLLLSSLRRVKSEGNIFESLSTIQRTLFGNDI